MEVAAILLCVGLAAALQMLGYTGTCTQNDTDPFLTGALLSAPLLLIALVLLLRSRSQATRSPMLVGGALAAALASGWLVAANLETVIETLVRLGSPCGPDFFERGRDIEIEHLLIGLAYGVLPFLTLSAAVRVGVFGIVTAQRLDGERP